MKLGWGIASLLAIQMHNSAKLVIGHKAAARLVILLFK
jgi:hypothetical protein